MTHQERLKKYRLTDGEYIRIKNLIGHEPNEIEWAVFSALWSEHCSYKSSRSHLKKFGETKNEFVLTDEGENAGVVALPTGEKVVFKMESHNHPSFIEPFQGAATGVGGILRDIFTMGARPIALANYLCFGEEQASRMKYLVKNVVAGISHYGNCVGVPMITGRTQFDAAYNNNILVNALAVGLLESNEKLALSKGQGIGNLVVFVGSKTGPDGVHGAAMASESFGEGIIDKRPNIQIGDPFLEKLLIESCLRVIQEDLVEAIQDMGAAGLTSSSFEMAAKGGVGFSIDLSRVPLRTQDLRPEDILLSESQERMLLICKPENYSKIKSIFSDYTLDCEVIGKVTEKKLVEIFWGQEILASIDPIKVVEQSPLYDRSTESQQPSSYPSYGFAKRHAYHHIYSQFDQRVGVRTMQDCSSDFGVVKLHRSGTELALGLGGRGEILKRNAQLGAQDALLWPTLKMASLGFRAIGATDCLNFGNPEKPEVMKDFVDSVDSLVATAKATGVAVVSGNVSFYNESLGKNIIPTPALGVVGFRLKGHDDVADQEGQHFALVQFSELRLRNGHREVLGAAPTLADWQNLKETLIDLAQNFPITSCQYFDFNELISDEIPFYLAAVGFAEASTAMAYIKQLEKFCSFASGRYLKANELNDLKKKPSAYLEEVFTL